MLATTPYIDASNLLQTSIRHIEKIYVDLMEEYNVDPEKLLELHAKFQESISHSLAMFAISMENPELISDETGESDDSI